MSWPLGVCRVLPAGGSAARRTAGNAAPGSASGIKHNISDNDKIPRAVPPIRCFTRLLPVLSKIDFQNTSQLFAIFHPNRPQVF